MPNLVVRRLGLELGVALEFQQIPGHGLELVESHDRPVVGVVNSPVTLDCQSGDVGKVLTGGDGIDNVSEGQLALADADGVSDVIIEVHLRRDAREPAAPDDGEIGVLLSHGLGGQETVVDLVAEDAGAGEAQGAIAGLEELAHVVRLDHGVDHHDLIAVGHGAGCDLQELQGQEVCAEALTALWICAMRQEQDDFLG